MQKVVFHKGWKVITGVKGPFDGLGQAADEGREVVLPHDAMIYEARERELAGGSQTGYYPSKDYTYIKEFEVPLEWKNKKVIFEFEGVSQRAMVFINGEPAGHHHYAYSGFFIEADEFLRYGETNTMKVLVISENLSSRWYPGSGIYRDINLWLGGQVHIPPEGIKILSTEAEDDYAILTINTDIHHAGTDKKKVCLLTKAVNAEGKAVAEERTFVTVKGGKDYHIVAQIYINTPKLWHPDEPNLYQLVSTLYEDETILDVQETCYGIRKLALDAVHGLRINQKPVKLRGACIHHDNGILGASTFRKAEEFRCRKLKEAGFNSIRSSHHPISKAMLEACDKLGMLVMDELGDMWREPKNPHDFAGFFEDSWRDEVKRMVNKDYNHPSVILYSLGNEIPDICRESGVELNRLIAGEVKKLDPSRYTTNGFNGLLVLGEEAGVVMADAMGLPLEELQAAMTDAGNDKSKEETKEGCDEMNHVMGSVKGEVWDDMAVHPLMTKKMEELSGALDVVGYNYMTARYELEKELHPGRIVVGSETYSTEIMRNWPIVKKNSHVIGDFTWTGYDYIGEVGIGDFTYTEDMWENGTAGDNKWPERLAYCGDINIIGYRRAISYLREIVFGLRGQPYIAVQRINRYGKEVYSTPWAYHDVIESWTWHGYEGRTTNVEVFSNEDEVELFLNGRSLGRKPAGEKYSFSANWKVLYEPGELEAVSYVEGKENGRFTLKTSKEAKGLSVCADTNILKADGQDLAFLTVKLVDEEGCENLQAVKTVTVEVEGVGSLQGFGNGNPRSEDSYQQASCETFDGYVMAVIRSGFEPGKILVSFHAEGCETKQIEIMVK